MFFYVDGGSPVTGYIIQKREKGSPYWQNATQVPAGQTKVKLQKLACTFH